MRMRAIAAVIGAVLAWVGCGRAMAQEAVGTNTAVVQTVRTRSATETAWHPSLVGGAVRIADMIVTGADSRLQVELRDRSVLTVGANASLTVDRFAFESEPDPLSAVFSVARGVFRFVSGSQGAEREHVSFRTPTATIGIRGTIIEGVVGPEALGVVAGDAVGLDLSQDPETAAVIVLVEGEIDLEVAGERVTIRQPGQAVLVSGRRLSQPFILSQSAIARFEARLPPRESGSGQGPGPDPQGPGEGQGQPPGQPQGQGQGQPQPQPQPQAAAQAQAPTEGKAEGRAQGQGANSGQTSGPAPAQGRNQATRPGTASQPRNPPRSGSRLPQPGSSVPGRQSGSVPGPQGPIPPSGTQPVPR